MLILACLLPVAAAFLVLSRVADLSSNSIWSHLSNLALGVGLGLGTSSLFLFLWLQVFGTAGTSYVVTEAAFCLCLMVPCALALRVRGRRHPCPPAAAPRPKSFSREVKKRLIPVCFLVVGITSLLALILWSMILPHGAWDAWAIWNLRARFLFFLGDLSPQAFAPYMPHTDYPLLIPLSVTRAWIFGKENFQLAPVLIAGLSGLATVTLLVSQIALRRGTLTGLVAGMILLATPGYLEQTASQTADVPLALYILATLVLLTHCERSGHNATFLLAGIFAGLAAWTKNEGLMFVLVVGLVCGGTVLRTQRGLRSLAAFTTGLIPAGLVVGWFKVSLAPPNDLVSGQSAQTLVRLLDGSRSVEILGTFGSTVFQHYFWLPVLIAGLLICGHEKRFWPRMAAATLALMLVGFFLVYLSSPQPLTWHLSFSLDRILLQLWPSLLFVIFSVLKDPSRHSPGRGQRKTPNAGFQSWLSPS